MLVNLKLFVIESVKTSRKQSNSSSTQAYIGTVDGEVKAMKPAKLDVVASFTHHTALVRGVRGMGGDKIVSISADNTVQCWSWEGGDATTTKLQSIAG